MTDPLPILTVTQLNRQVRSWLEHEIGGVRVEGEVSNLSKPASGHFYFSLKDATAQIRCVYFRNRHAVPDSKSFQNGQQVLAYGTLSLYEARGDYQLIVEQLEASGQGDLYRQFELLKTKLATLGLFDAARKRDLPCFPRSIGIVTSSTGAALRDILSTLARRFPIAEVIIYPSEVQGKQAAHQLIGALLKANQEKRCEVLILARGGGSIEDLWAFNDEKLAYTIANSTIPIVAGIGHETDFTIADFVADLRAATPTAAAEAVSPDRLELTAQLQTLETRLLKAITRFIQHLQWRLQHEIQKITSPRQLISAHWQSLDYLRNHLQHAMQQLLAQKHHSLHWVTIRLNTKNPAILLQQSQTQLQQIENQLKQLAMLCIHHHKQQLLSQMATLHAVSPLATLERGYSITTFQGKVLTDNREVSVGEVVSIRLSKGHLMTKVIS